jgi:hypothetical protein
MRALVLLFSIFMLSMTSCATLIKENCLSTNWEAQGRSDGRNGKVAQIDEVQSFCASSGAKIDRAAYLRAYKTGLKAFCAPENGKLVGSQGQEYKRVCPVHLEPQFLAGYNEGKAQYDARAFNQSLLSALTTKSRGREKRACTFDSDCVRRSPCRSEKCYSTGASCNVDSDCDVQGACFEDRCDYPRVR